jgi:hypothetical protein
MIFLISGYQEKQISKTKTNQDKMEVQGNDKINLWLEDEIELNEEDCCFSNAELQFIVSDYLNLLTPEKLRLLLKRFTIDAFLDLRTIMKIRGEVGVDAFNEAVKKIDECHFLDGVILGEVKKSKLRSTYYPFYYRCDDCYYEIDVDFGENDLDQERTCPSCKKFFKINQRPRSLIHHTPYGFINPDDDPDIEDVNKAVKLMIDMKIINPQWGDIVHFPVFGDYRNDGKYIFDGNKVLELDYSEENDEYGCVPDEFTLEKCDYERYYFSQAISHNLILKTTMDDKEIEVIIPNRRLKMTCGNGDTFFIVWSEEYYGDEIDDDDLKGRNLEEEVKRGVFNNIMEVNDTLSIV